MAKKEEIKITIKPDGQVDMTLEGFGKACDDYMKMFQELLSAKVKEKKLSAEYYSDQTKVSNTQKTKY
ncbi:MAG: DUF2997 domain-containing protein [Candidatus Riflebacteria bacterium]|nr:DUF2997 domain-containing protein [Candidatus Riflebacteria bacterium]